MARLIRYIEPSNSYRSGTPALFLDRDGVLNEEEPGRYITDPSQVRLLHVAIGACRLAMRHGMPLVVVTNQGVVGRNVITATDLMRIHARLVDLLARRGVRLDAIYACPHHPSAYEPSMRCCRCRKPDPGLLLAAAQDLELNLASSIMIGDQETDRAAAVAAGLSFENVYLTGDLPPHEQPARALTQKMASALDSGQQTSAT